MKRTNKISKEMNFPLSISTYGELILFGKWTGVKLAGTIWEKLIMKILGIKNWYLTRIGYFEPRIYCTCCGSRLKGKK